MRYARSTRLARRVDELSQEGRQHLWQVLLTEIASSLQLDRLSVGNASSEAGDELHWRRAAFCYAPAALKQSDLPMTTSTGK